MRKLTKHIGGWTRPKTYLVEYEWSGNDDELQGRDRTFVICLDGELKLTYGTWYNLEEAIADNWLDELDKDENTRASVMLYNVTELKHEYQNHMLVDRHGKTITDERRREFLRLKYSQWHKDRPYK
jgi:hypothetical protein